MNPLSSTTADQAKVKIACIQMQPAIGKVEANVARSIELIDRAVESGAKLIVLPELSNTGYMFQSREEAFALSEPVPSGRTVNAWSEIAAKHKLHLVAGICERDGAKLFNSAVLIGPQGYVGTFRKVHLWNEENLYFEPGDLGFPVFHTAIGRIGMAICYDGWFPETYRLAALQGADIVCVPTNWVPIPGQAEGRPAGTRRSLVGNRRTAGRPGAGRRSAGAARAGRAAAGGPDRVGRNNRRTAGTGRISAAVPAG